MSGIVRWGREVDFAALEPYAAPEIERLEIAKINTLTRPYKAALVSYPYGELRLRPMIGARPAQDIDFFTIAFHVAGREGQIFMQGDALRYSLSQAFPQTPDLELDSFDPVVRALLVEEALGVFLSQMESALRAPIRITSVEVASGRPRAWSMSIEASLAEGEAFPVFIKCHRIERDALLRWMKGLAFERHDLSNLKATISFRAGQTTLSAAELASLDAGSGIILDGTYLAYQKIATVIGEQFVQTCTWQTAKPVLDGPMLRRIERSTKIFTMEGDVSENADSQQFGSARDVQINVVFELGRLDMTVAELETLGQGHVFDLGKPLSQAVDVIAGGKRIGTGELVRIADTIGVRIVRIAT